MLPSYQINIRTDNPNYSSNGADLTVYRRYSDFVWLAEYFCTQYPFIVVPPVPSKKLFGNFDNEFIESRRRDLERFLRRIASHEILLASPQFIMFCTCEEEDLAKNIKSLENKPLTSFYGKMKTLVVSNPVSNATSGTIRINRTLDFNSHEVINSPLENIPTEGPIEPLTATSIPPDAQEADIYSTALMKALQSEYTTFLKTYARVEQRLEVKGRRYSDFSSILTKLRACETDDKDKIVQTYEVVRVHTAYSCFLVLAISTNYITVVVLVVLPTFSIG